MYTYNTALFFVFVGFFYSFVLNNLVTMHLWYKSILNFIINTQNIRISRISFFSSICRSTFGNKYSS